MNGQGLLGFTGAGKDLHVVVIEAEADSSIQTRCGLVSFLRRGVYEYIIRK